MKLVGGPADGTVIELHPLSNWAEQHIQDKYDFLRMHVYRPMPIGWNLGCAGESYYAYSYYRDYSPELLTQCGNL